MLKFQINSEVVAQAAGTFNGLNAEFSDDKYLDGLAEQAHTAVSLDFDLAAAATASTGRITHVYEFGVAGITRGTARIGDPTSAAARLYVHDIVGSNGKYTMAYYFRPAVQPNPRPSVATTGIADKYVRKLSRRKYIFRNKASIMELGTSVEIKPKNGDWLVIPFDGQPPRNELNKRGFVLWHYPSKGPIHSVPGRQTKGTFTTFFETWWKTDGTGLMDQMIEKNVNADVEKQLAESAAKAASIQPKPVKAQRSNSVEAKERARVKAELRRTSTARSANKRR